MARYAEDRKLLQAYRLDSTDPNETFALEDAAEKPWRKVALAAGLMLGGLVLFSVGMGLMFGSNKDAPALPLIILGSICLVPGGYYSVLAFRAWRGHRGYSLNAIPDF